MRIGIVTQPLYANYGGILQNYALQQILKRMGHSPVTLDYMPSLPFSRYLLYAGKGLLCSFSPRWRHPIKPYRHFLERPHAIRPFIEKNIHLTKTLTHYSKSVLRKNGIQALIVGSDQVWRYSYNSHYLEDMFLSFAEGYPCRKVAYGASFGVDDWDYPPERTSNAQELLKKFDAISVRESSAAKLCSNFLGFDAEVVLDPTLLLSSADYEPLCQKSCRKTRSYLAAYILDINDEKRAFIEATAKIRGLEIQDMTVSDDGVSIESWLSTIKNAEYVITDSYHGSLFSIIFQKQFLTILNKDRGEDRFWSLFNRLGLRQYIIDSIPAQPTAPNSINYEAVTAALSHLQRESLSFLHHALH